MIDDQSTDDFYCEQVLSGKTPVVRVAETETCLAFYHTRPAYPVHIVVIPKQHVPSLVDLGSADELLLADLLHLVRAVAAEVLATHGACRVITNLGSYLDSKHLHWHVVSGDRLSPSP